jgi:hypothetical protein
MHCSARVTRSSNGEYTINGEHFHEPETQFLANVALESELKEAMQNNQQDLTRPKRIFDEIRLR